MAVLVQRDALRPAGPAARRAAEREQAADFLTNAHAAAVRTHARLTLDGILAELP